MIGMASALFKSRKFKIMAVSAQLAYMSYKYLKEKKRKRHTSKEAH